MMTLGAPSSADLVQRSPNGQVPRNDGQDIISILEATSQPGKRERLDKTSAAHMVHRQSPQPPIQEGMPVFDSPFEGMINPKRAGQNGVAQRRPLSAERGSPVVENYQLVGGSNMRRMPASQGHSGAPSVQRISPDGSNEDAKEGPREYSADEIEFLASKVYRYIKNKLAVERERHGRPGFALWQ